MDDLNELDALQQALLDALERGEDPSESVRAHAPAWVRHWSPKAISVAGVLVRRWTRRRPS